MSSEGLPSPGGVRRSTLSDDNTVIEKPLRDHISSILRENVEKINNLDVIKTVTDWYKQGKHDPKKIPSIILNRIIDELPNSINQYFINYLTDSISTRIRLHTEDDLATQVDDFEFDCNFVPYVEFLKVSHGNKVPPSVTVTSGMEFIKASDGKKVPPSVTVTFGVRIQGKVEGAKINTSATVSGDMVLNLNRILFLLTISIMGLKGSRLDVPIPLSSPKLVVIRNTSWIPKIMPKDS